MRKALAAYVSADQARRTTPPPSVWPETDEETKAFVDYKFEVANGDTAASFRDWYSGEYVNRYASEESRG